MTRPRVFLLMFGPYDSLHHRVLRSFAAHLPVETPLCVWLNELGRDSRAHWDKFRKQFMDVEVWESSVNTPKYKAMRLMFEGFKNKRYEEEWAIWFDDDSYIQEHDWLVRSMQYVEAKQVENPRYMGQRWSVNWNPGQQEFIKASSWYRGLTPELIKGRPGVGFCQGAYWWLHSDLIRQLDWPDARLNHNGGDTMLGEAVRQQGLKIHPYYYGVCINDGERRGYREAPAGCTNKLIRI